MITRLTPLDLMVMELVILVTTILITDGILKKLNMVMLQTDVRQGLTTQDQLQVVEQQVFLSTVEVLTAIPSVLMENPERTRTCLLITLFAT